MLSCHVQIREHLTVYLRREQRYMFLTTISTQNPLFLFLLYFNSASKSLSAQFLYFLMRSLASFFFFNLFKAYLSDINPSSFNSLFILSASVSLTSHHIRIFLSMPFPQAYIPLKISVSVSAVDSRPIRPSVKT